MGFRKSVISLFLSVALVTGCASREKNETLRVGYLPNITHLQALIGQSNAYFKRQLAPAVNLEWKGFNAGPSVIEALFAGELDMAYVGPSPAVNGYIKSGGEAVSLVAGAASGGAALVVREEAGIAKLEDFHGKRIATPQLGNTQDVALRSWLLTQGLKSKENGGDITIFPVANADIFTLFLKKEIDAAWTVEPWVSLLVQNAGGKVFLDEASLWPQGEYATTVLLVRKDFLEKHPKTVKRFVRAHVELTEWIVAHPEESKTFLNQKLEEETGKTLAPQVMNQAFSRIKPTYELLRTSVEKQATAAFHVGFLKKEPDVSGLFVSGILDEVLKEHEESDRF